MNKLIPFDGIYLKNLEIFSDLTADFNEPSILTLQIKIEDELNEVDWPAPTVSPTNLLDRQDELWKSTCFEMFLNPVGHNQYYEFNFSPNAAWNCYHFAGYRFPQPPDPSVDFKMADFQFVNNQMVVQIQNHSAFKNFNVGLTAVIKNKKDQITYFALKHENNKPDFHLASTFTLNRGS